MDAYVLSCELLLLREGSNLFKVPCAWGVDPAIAFLPRAGEWDSIVPDWLHGHRRDVVQAIERLRLAGQG